MQTPPQPQQPNAVQATQSALQQSQTQPNEEQDSFGSEITKNLQDHLNTLDDKQKQFLAESLQHYANIVIPVLGIVCGQEVFQYFVDVYKQHFAKGAAQTGQPPVQQNSAPNPQDQGPNSSMQAAPQQAAPQQATQSQF